MGVGRVRKGCEPGPGPRVAIEDEVCFPVDVDLITGHELAEGACFDHGGHQTCSAVFRRSLDSYFTRCMSRHLWLSKSLSNGEAEIWHSFQRNALRTIPAMPIERLPWPTSQASCSIAGDVRW